MDDGPWSEAVPNRDLLPVWTSLHQISNSLSNSLHPTELLVACGRAYKSFGLRSESREEVQVTESSMQLRCCNDSSQMFYRRH